MRESSILSLIAEYKMEKALEEAAILFPESISEIIALRARFTKANQDYYIRGVISDQDFNLEINKIINALLLIVTKQTNTGTVQFLHPLHRFPRGPLVPQEKIPRSLYNTYATVIDYRAAPETILEARKLRLEADNDPMVTAIRLIDLPPHDTVPPVEYWRQAFNICSKHGPRMLGALLLVVPDDLFPQLVKEDRRALIRYMETMWNQ